MTSERCHCGLPLHYTHPETQRFVEAMVAELGPCVIVTVAGRSWLVPRHYLALHGLRAADVPHLGFKEITP
jgi:hypothetical protein